MSKMPRVKISTNSLVRLLTADKNVDFEVSLNNGVFNATHFLRFGGRKIYDIGIDSQQSLWNISEFTAWYNEANWLVDQIVH